MRKLKTLFTVLFLAVLGLGNVWAVDPDYTLTPTAGSENGYATAEDITVGGITWNVTGNSTLTPWRIGGKNLSSVDRAVYSKTAYASAVSKIDLSVGAASNVTVNSLKLVYSTNADFSSSSEISGAFAVNSTISFAPASGDFPKNAYYKFVFNVTIGGNNKFIEFKKVEFYNATSGNPDPEEPTLQSIAVSGTPDKTAYKVGDAFDPAGLVVTGTYSKGDPKAITEGITWAVTPETLTEGLTSVSVTATVSGKTSAAYVVNGLTVTAPDPSVSFIFNTDAGLSALDIAKPASGKGTNLDDAAYTSGVITMTATDGGTATRVWNSSGTTDLRIYANGGTLTFTGATITKIELAGSTVNGFTANVGTYATNTWSGSATSVILTATATEKINTITVSYVAGSAAETVATPVLPAEGAFVGSKEIELSCETAGASIYYTLDGTDPTSASTLYNGAFTLTETATVKAIAVKDGMLNSSVASATYTKVVTLNSMDEIFAAATTAGSTAASKVITFDNWVISGVKNNNAYLTDNNGKGLIIYQSGHGFVVGDILSGTATCNVQLYNGSAELTALTSATDGLTVNKEGVVTPITSASIADLGGVNTGAIYSFSNLTYNGSEFSDGENTIKPYNTFITLPTLLTGKSYNVTGMYLQFNAVKEILPRTEDDIEAAASDVTLTSIAISGTVTKNEYYVGDAFDKAGLIVTATYSDASTLDVTSSAEWSFDPAALDNTSIATVNVTATFNEVSSEAYPVAVTVAPVPLKVTWDLSKDETASASADALSWTSDYATMGVAKGESTTATNNYYPGTSGKTYTSTRFYTNSIVTITPEDGYAIDKVEFTATSTSYANAFQGSTWANASAAVSSTLVTVTPTDGEAAISATIGGNCGFTSVVVYYHVGATKYNVVENLTGCSADEENAKKFVDGTDELTLYYTLTDGYIWPENITVKVGETVLSAEEVDYLWEVADEIGTLEIAYEMHDNLNITISATAKEVESIAVKTAPTKVEYYVGDNFDPAGLVITATYNDESTTDIAYADAAADFSFAPALDAALALGDKNVVITFNGKTCNQAISVTKAPLVATWVAEEQGYANETAVVGSAIKHETTTMATVTFNKAEGSNDPKYYTSGEAARAYYGNTIAVSALKGFTIKKIVLTFGASDGSNVITTDAGEYADGTWTGEATEVTFTIGVNSSSETKGNRRIAGISVYYEGELATPTGIVLNTDDVKKEFAFGETFNSANLVVKAVYSDESEEDVTLAAEVVAPNMETAGVQAVTVNYLTFSETYNITVAEPTPVLTVTPATLAFGTVNINDVVEAKTVAVTLEHLAAATVVLSGSDKFSIDVTSLTESGNVTISATADEKGEFTATLTISGEGVEDKTVALSMTVVVPDNCDGSDDFETATSDNPTTSYKTRTTTDGWEATNALYTTIGDEKYLTINGKTTAVGVITSPVIAGLKDLKIRYANTFSENNGASFRVDVKVGEVVAYTKTITRAEMTTNEIYTAELTDINVANGCQIVITNLSPSNNSSNNKDRVSIGRICYTNYTGAAIVATIAGTGYTTLAAAVAAAAAEDEIVLLADVEENIVVPAGKTFTLDLNGHTLNGAQAASTATIKNLGTLTVENGTVLRSGAGSDSYYIIENEGTMTLNCNVTGSASSSLIRNNAAAAKMTFKGGEYTQTGAFIVVKNDLGEVIINGGTFATANDKNVLNNWNQMTINGGTFNGNIFNGAYDTNGNTLTITDGTFNTNKIRTYLGNGKTDANIVITGGTFTSESLVYQGPTSASDAQIAISGGTFHTAVPAVYCAEDFQPKDNGNGTYGVQEAIKVTGIVLGGEYAQSFTVGDEFTFGGTVTAKYNREKADADVTSDATFKGYDMNTLGKQTVTVSYTENEVEVTATYEILVKAAAGSMDKETVDFTAVEPYASMTSGTASMATYSGASFEMTFAKKDGTQYGPTYYFNGTAVRCYKDNTITIVAVDPILGINVDWISEYVDGAMTTVYSVDKKTATLTFSKTCRFTAITVYYKTTTLRDKLSGNAGTICLSRNATNLSGATFWEIAGTKDNKLFVDEVTTDTLKAGVGYIFVPTATEITGILYGKTVDEPELAEDHNGMQGTLTYIAGNILKGNYLLSQNKIVLCGDGCSLAANRAYIDMTYVPTNVSEPAPGRRRIAFGNANAEVTTGIDNLTEDGVAAQKVMINGQLFIIRGEKMYNVEGQLVK